MNMPVCSDQGLEVVYGFPVESPVGSPVAGVGRERDGGCWKMGIIRVSEFVTFIYYPRPVKNEARLSFRGLFANWVAWENN